MKATYLYNLLRTSFAMTLVVFFMYSCNKSKTEDISYTADHTIAEQTFDDIQSISEQAAGLTTGATLDYKTTATTISGCATVTSEPGVITIDFGNTNCECKDGRTRRGKIIITYAGNYFDSGTVHTITFDEFFQGDNKVTGTKTVTNLGFNRLGEPYYKIHIDGSVTLKSGGTIGILWNRERTWTAGYDTPDDKSDDVFNLLGAGTLTRPDGSVLNINITIPLVVATSCKWAKAGTVIFTLPGGKTKALNYGDTPTCDEFAKMTLSNGTVKTITLP